MDIDPIDLLGLFSPRTLVVGAGVVMLAGGAIYASVDEDPDLALIAAAVASGASKEDLRELRDHIKRAREEGRAPSSYDSRYGQGSTPVDDNWNAGTFGSDYDAEGYSGE